MAAICGISLHIEFVYSAYLYWEALSYTTLILHDRESSNAAARNPVSAIFMDANHPNINFISYSLMDFESSARSHSSRPELRAQTNNSANCSGTYDVRTR